MSESTCTSSRERPRRKQYVAAPAAYLLVQVRYCLRLGRSRLDVHVDSLMMMDSLDMTDVDRNRIVERCRSCEEHAIVITHGTDTMVDTARALGRAALPGRTIVLTGAMVPYAFGSSDGLFNLGSALSVVQVLPNGVYFAMNGRYSMGSRPEEPRNRRIRRDRLRV